MNEYLKLSDRFEETENKRAEPADGIGLCLSGGGFKAATFHLGALIRLNEIGALQKIDRISSVSGGSITAAWLGLNWSRLSFSPQGEVATNFKKVIVDPLLRFVSEAEIDVESIWTGIRRRLLGGSQTGAERLAKCYRELLFGEHTLLDLPLDKDDSGKKIAPRFVINASSLQNNALWRMSRRYVANYKIGVFEQAAVPLATAVAASSAFPPVLSPAILDLRGAALRPGSEGELFSEDFDYVPIVADGGVYDNLGLEPVWKRYKTVLVSNAGDPFQRKEEPPSDWLNQTRRIISMMHRNEENNRLRWLIDMAKSEERKVALWSLRGRAEDFGLNDSLALDEEDAMEAAQQEVRLRPLDRRKIEQLVNHGYSLSDASLRAFWIPDARAPSRFPEIF